MTVQATQPYHHSVSPSPPTVPRRGDRGNASISDTHKITSLYLLGQTVFYRMPTRVYGDGCTAYYLTTNIISLLLLLGIVISAPSAGL